MCANLGILHSQNDLLRLLLDLHETYCLHFQTIGLTEIIQ